MHELIKSRIMHVMLNIYMHVNDEYIISFIILNWFVA